MVADTCGLCEEFIVWRNQPEGVARRQKATILSDRAYILDLRFQKLISSIPPRFRHGRIPKDQCQPLPYWLSPFISDHRAPRFVDTYAGFGPCFFWNMMRFARVRLHQLRTVLIGTKVSSGATSDSIKTIIELEDEISSTVVASLVATSERPISQHSSPDEIPSLRSLLAIRSLYVAEMTLRFLAQQGLCVQERLAWLRELSASLQAQLSSFAPLKYDPLVDDHIPDRFLQI